MEHIREEVEYSGKLLAVDVTTGGYVVHEERWAFAWARERFSDSVLLPIPIGDT